MACVYYTGLTENYNKTTSCSTVHCFSLWFIKQDKSKFIQEYKLLSKGCWPDSKNCVSNFAKNVLFCCCKDRHCNKELDPGSCYKKVQEELSWSKMVKILKKLFYSTLPNIKSNYLIILVFLVIGIFIVLLFLYLRSFCKKNESKLTKLINKIFKLKRINEYDEEKLTRKDSDEIKRGFLKLENGSHADIYKGRLIKKNNEIEVAIKIYGLENKVYFKNEYQVYNLPNFQHENVLKFMKAKIVDQEYWLITMYKENGSLLNYLKSNIINLKQLMQICSGISNGLAYLHGQNNKKLTIAHLDIKPANILLDFKLNAYLADFELSKVFYNSKLLFDNNNNDRSLVKDHFFTDNQRQAGTLCYLSPELLNRTINIFKIPRTLIYQYIDLLLKSDIYSCALIYWEVLNCLEDDLNFQPNQYLYADCHSKYKRVFRNCLTDEDLINYVAIKRERPKFNKKWRSNCILNAFCETIEECWSHDPKARLTACLLNERLKVFKSRVNQVL